MGRRSSDVCRLGLLAVVIGALIASITVAIPVSPASAAEHRCDANLDSFSDGEFETIVTDGNDSDATLLRSLGWFDDYFEPNRTEPWEVRICREGEDLLLLPELNGTEQQLAAETSAKFRALSSALEKLGGVKKPGTEMFPAPNQLQIVGIDSLLGLDEETLSQVIEKDSVVVAGVTVEVEVRPIESIWTFDDGTAPIVCGWPETPFAERYGTPLVGDECRKKWERVGSGTVNAALSLHYVVAWQSFSGQSPLNRGAITELGPSATFDLRLGEFDELVVDEETGERPEPPVQLEGADQIEPESEGCPGLFQLICAIATALVDLTVGFINFIGGAVVEIARQLWNVVMGCVDFAVEVFTSFVEVLRMVIDFIADPVGFIGEKVDDATAVFKMFVDIAWVTAQDPAEGWALMAELLGDLLEPLKEEFAEKGVVRFASKFICEGIASIFTGGGASGAGTAMKLIIKESKKFIEIIKDFIAKVKRKNRGSDRDDGNADSGRRKGLCPTRNSFPAGTLVLMADGGHVPIELVEPGNRVTTYNTESGVWSGNVVLDQWSGVHTDPMVTVTLSGGATIQSTDDHLFWVESDQMWIEAHRLRAGDMLLGLDGTTTVAYITVHTPTPTTVWELDTAVNDNFVVSIAPGTDTLVHNDETPYYSCDGPPDPTEYPEGSDKYISTELELEFGKKWDNIELSPRWIDDTKRKYNPNNPDTWLYNDKGEQPPNPSKNPDYIVDGEFREIFSPMANNPAGVLRNLRDGKIKQGQAQRFDINLDRSEVTIEELTNELDDMIKNDYGGSVDAFRGAFTYTRKDGSGQKFPLEEITVLKDDVWVTIWPRPVDVSGG